MPRSELEMGAERKTPRARGDELVPLHNSLTQFLKGTAERQIE